MITATVTQPSRRTQSGLTNSPIRRFSLVNWSRGNHGKGKLQAQHHLVSTSRAIIDFSPAHHIASSAGKVTAASPGGALTAARELLTKPSITTWPRGAGDRRALAEASSATAKAPPASGRSRLFKQHVAS